LAYLGSLMGRRTLGPSNAALTFVSIASLGAILA
jgi:hypothetical protein